MPLSASGCAEPFYRSSRTFRMWRYGVGHSQLLLRATPTADHATCLDLHFEGVAAVRLGTRYVAPHLRPCDRSECEVLAESAQLDAGSSFRYAAIAVESASGTGLVLCTRVRALRGGTDLFGGIEGSEVLWSHRAERRES